MAGSLIAALGDVDRYLPWTAIGRRLGPLRAVARTHGHQPRRWSTLFNRRSPYRVYWTRCQSCWADGRLIISRETSHGTATYRPWGPIFTQQCGPRTLHGAGDMGTPNGAVRAGVAGRSGDT